jgi:tetratricopeptide (TPR) repeat protein
VRRERAKPKAEAAKPSGAVERKRARAATTKRAGPPSSRPDARPRTPVEARRSSVPPPPARPEEYLYRALGAKTARARGLWARRGLATRGLLDRTTQSMLLRQLYLAYFEERRFAKALDAAEQIVGLGILPDVAHQDAARAAQALGLVDRAAGHLRLAARVGPPKRKAFHWWTLGSIYFLARRYEDALGAMARAARWGTTDRPLYQGQIAVIRCASGERVEDLGGLRKRLAEVPAGQGYGRFVLGQLAFYDERWDEARRYLEAFVRRTLSGRAAMAIALDGEVAAARELLGRIGAS